MKVMRNLPCSFISQQSVPLNPSLLWSLDVHAAESSPGPASIPLVSIIIRMFSVLAYILNLGESVSGYTENLFSAAIIIVDGNSLTKRGRIVKEYADELQKTATTSRVLEKENMAGNIN